ncbi:hypothetical protein HY494_01175 [Candidatus Woesearchaeota archaeon]|nr:hypothetical protein [Candidatus Woesearchaeota archaeon]
MPAKKIDSKRIIPLFPEFSPLRVKYKDVFDFKAFYEELWEWCKEHGWKDWEMDLDSFERFYGERITTGGVKEIWIRWRAYKPAEGIPLTKQSGKEVGYLTYHLDVDFHVLGLSSTEIVKDGKKIKADKGEIEISIRTFIEKNYEYEFANHSFLRHFLDIFTARIYKQKLEERQREIYREAYVMQTYIKQWFKMKTYLPYVQGENFFPSKAWPSHQ